MVLHSGKNKIAKFCVSPSRPSVRLLSLGVPGEVPLDLLLLHAHQLQHGPQLPLLEALLLPAAAGGGGGGCRQPPPLELFPPPPRPRASLRSWLVLVVISCPGRNVLRIRSVGSGAATRHLLQTPASQVTETLLLLTVRGRVPLVDPRRDRGSLWLLSSAAELSDYTNFCE